MRTKLAIIGAAVCLARAAFAITMASQPWTMNRIAEADARIASNIVEAIDGIPAPDFSQNNTQLRATIAAVSPPADLTDATNHTRAALSAFAGTGTVERARSYGTPTRWTDATGCVWDVVKNVWFDHRDGNIFVNGVSIFPSDTTAGDMKGYLYYDPSAMEFVGGTGGGWYYNNENTSGTPCVLAGGPDSTSLDSGNLTLGNLTNLVGRLALTNDIPATLPESDPTVPSWAKAEAKPSYSWNEITGKPQVVDETGAAAIAETVVREKSLGGIWDTQLEVWWTPVMRNGALTYQATTNVNLNAEN